MIIYKIIDINRNAKQLAKCLSLFSVYGAIYHETKLVAPLIKNLIITPTDVIFNISHKIN